MRTTPSMEESMRWARDFVHAANPAYGSDLWRCLDLGSRAVVAFIDGNDYAAAWYAEGAAHAAHLAVPSLRE